MRRQLAIVGLSVALCACGRPPQPAAAKHEPADGRTKVLADAYLSAWLDRNPDQGTYFGVPGRHHDRLPDNSIAALTAWHKQEDDVPPRHQADQSRRIESEPLRATYAITREALEAAIGARVCRGELWTVSQFVNAWQVSFGYLVTIQPVGTDEARAEALTRWGALPKYIDTEIVNLRDGLKAGLFGAERECPHRHRPDEHAHERSDSPIRRSIRRRCATRLRSSGGGSTRW